MLLKKFEQQDNPTHISSPQKNIWSKGGYHILYGEVLLCAILYRKETQVHTFSTPCIQIKFDHLYY
jgi:hypothetical protein